MYMAEVAAEQLKAELEAERVKKPQFEVVAVLLSVELKVRTTVSKSCVDARHRLMFIHVPLKIQRHWWVSLILIILSLSE